MFASLESVVCGALYIMQLQCIGLYRILGIIRGRKHSRISRILGCSRMFSCYYYYYDILTTKFYVAVSADNERNTAQFYSDGIVKCEKCNSLLDLQGPLCETCSAFYFN